MKGPRYPLELTEAEYRYVRACIETAQELNGMDVVRDRMLDGLSDKLQRSHPTVKLRVEMTLREAEMIGRHLQEPPGRPGPGGDMVLKQAQLAVTRIRNVVRRVVEAAKPEVKW